MEENAAEGENRVKRGENLVEREEEVAVEDAVDNYNDFKIASAIISPPWLEGSMFFIK